MGIDPKEKNSKAWDWEAEHGSAWARSVTEDDILEARSGRLKLRITINKYVPESWTEGLKGERVLLLGGAGGQQTPLLAAYGSAVYTVDISPRMLEKDRETLERHNLQADLHLGAMEDLSPFPSSSFRAVIAPESLNFTENLGKVYDEAFRVLSPGGDFLLGLANPALYMFDDRLLSKGRMKIKYTLPFSDLKSLSGKELEKRLRDHDTVEFSHTLSSILGGLAARGFAITGFFTDTSGFEPVDSFLQDAYLAVKASKPR